MDVKNKIIFITGASSGLGKALSERFLENNDCVLMAARRVEEMSDLAKKYPKHCLPLSCDVTSRESVQAAVKIATAHFGRIDIMVANAGCGYPSGADEFDITVFEKVMAVNYMGALYCFEAVLPQMIKRKSGQIVGISNLASYRGLRGAGAYCSSKAALVSVMESFRMDLKQYNVSATLVCPGFIKTPMTDRNLYKMPFLMPLEKGVDHIYTAILRKKAKYSFPWQMATLVKIGRLLPVWLYDALISSRKNIKKLD